MRLNSVDDAFHLLATKGDGAYGLAGVTQLEHALQSAALARARGLGPALTVAALLHDIGHLLHDGHESLAAQGVDGAHEAAGAAMLAGLFGPDVVEPIRLHVPAKRWLCATQPGYFDRLAPDSVRSLALQGGPMNDAEAEAFAALPYARAAAELRQIDDDAKTPGLAVPPLDCYRAMALKLALQAP